jgi:hypothetical protein
MKFMNVLKLFAEKKDQFERKQGWIARLPNLDANVKTLLTTISKYYEQYPEHEYIGNAEMKEFYEYLYPGSRDKDTYFELIDAMYEAEVSTNVQEDLTEQAIEMAFAQDICNKLLPVAQGHKFGIVPSIVADIEEFTGQMRRPPASNSDLVMNSYDPWELLQANLNYEGPSWNLEPLNGLLGPIQLQTLGCIYGFVDSGKSSCVLDVVAKAAPYYVGTEERIAVMRNEEPGHRTATRLQMAFMGKNRHELNELGEDELGVALQDKGWNNVLISDNNVTHVNKIRKCLELYNPRILIVDQGAKVNHDFQCKEVDTLRALYGWLREMAEQFNCAIITVEQGIGDANSKQWLQLTDIYNSRVGLQGELDYAIGIGKIADIEARKNFRYFNITKNKLFDGQKAKFTTHFDEERCIWKSLD